MCTVSTLELGTNLINPLGDRTYSIDMPVITLGQINLPNRPTINLLQTNSQKESSQQDPKDPVESDTTNPTHTQCHK